MVATMEHLNRDVRAGGPQSFVVKRDNDLVEVEVERDDLVTPEEQRYKCLEFHGIATKTRDQVFDGETTVKIALLLRIIDSGDPLHKGMFTSEVTYEGCGPQSTIGQIFTAIRGEPFVGHMDNAFWLSVLGGRFSATVRVNEKGYVSINHKSAQPAKTAAAATPAAEATPSKPPKPAPAKTANPFDDDDE